MSKTFLARFPEFAENLNDGDKEIIALTIEAAKTELNRAQWGELFEEGVLFLTADKLTRSRAGEALRDPDDALAKSVYAVEFERLCRIVNMGARVL
jgi:hypothetical protein